VDNSGVGVRLPVKSVSDAEVEGQSVGVGVKSDVGDALGEDAGMVSLYHKLLLVNEDSDDSDVSWLLEGNEVAGVEDHDVGVGVKSEVDEALEPETGVVSLDDGLLLVGDDSDTFSLLEDDDVAEIDDPGIGVRLKLIGKSEVAGALEENNE
jgi:hypothetical protein